MFSCKPILAMWEPNRPTRLKVDTSGYATGGILFQRLDNNLWHPIAY
jgi:RNase H-like domain found in reverse transcriptase